MSPSDVKQDIERLDKIQNQALRFISGALRSTPTAACEIHRNVEPLRLRREAAVVECVERYKRKDKNHPNAKLVENWKPTRRLQRKSILDVAQDLQEKYHLPENREVASVTDKLLPPYICNATPEIKTSLVQDINKRNTDTTTIITTAHKTIDSYPDQSIHVYTGGSAFKGTINAGYGSNIQFPDKTRHELSNPRDLNCSNFEAEALAIESSLHHLQNVFEITPGKKDLHCYIQ